MTFKRLSGYFAQLEATSLRLEMTRILSDLFKEASNDEIGKICYLLQGRVAPLYEAIEFGMADKMMMKAVAQGLGIGVNQILKAFQKEGDIGNATANLKSQISNLKSQSLKILDVFDVLLKAATAGGEGSQEEKINLLGNLIKEVDPLSARYIVRIPLNKLRLGFSDMTILDALSWMMTGTKEHRAEIEKAYNVRPDLAFISQTIKERGIKGLKHVVPEVGTPILMMRAERMTSGTDIIEKLGKCAIEPKYDGLRLQAHLSRSKKSKVISQKSEKDTSGVARRDSPEVEEMIRLFSRNLEDVTAMYPDIVEGVKKQIKAREAIFEGEAVGINIKTGQYLPFQETVQRKRKYDVEIKSKEIPLKLFAFDLLYIDGESLLDTPFAERRKRLEEIVN